MHTGDHAGARRLLRSTLATGRPVSAELAHHRLRGLLDEAVGATAAAENAYRAGLAVAARASVTDEDWLLERTELHAALARLGKGPDTAMHRELAHAQLTRLGAHTRAAQFAERTGRTTTTTLPPASALTSRERQVAGLVAQGMTNREVAQALWITPKAVDFHMGNIFAKLGISSRRALRGHTFS